MAMNVNSQDVVYVIAPPKNCYCSICKKIMVDVTQCPKGHSFCSGCIERSLEQRKECPICKVHMASNKLTKNLIIQSIIDKLPTFCVSCSKPNATTTDSQLDECKWTGILAERVSHYENDCNYRPVLCPNSCGRMVQKRFVQQHITSVCPNQPVECKFCKTLIAAKALRGHTHACSRASISCPNDCGAFISRGALKQHLDSECLNSFERCPLFDSGLCFDCTGTFPRNKQGEHFGRPERSVGIMLMLAVKSVEHTKKLDALGRQNAELIEKNTELCVRVEDLLKENEAERKKNTELEALLRVSGTVNGLSLDYEDKNQLKQKSAPSLVTSVEPSSSATRNKQVVDESLDDATTTIKSQSQGLSCVTKAHGINESSKKLIAAIATQNSNQQPQHPFSMRTKTVSKDTQEVIPKVTPRIPIVDKLEQISGSTSTSVVHINGSSSVAKEVGVDKSKSVDPSTSPPPLELQFKLNKYGERVIDKDDTVDRVHTTKSLSTTPGSGSVAYFSTTQTPRSAHSTTPPLIAAPPPLLPLGASVSPIYKSVSPVVVPVVSSSRLSQTNSNELYALHHQSHTNGDTLQSRDIISQASSDDRSQQKQRHLGPAVADITVGMSVEYLSKKEKWVPGVVLEVNKSEGMFLVETSCKQLMDIHISSIRVAVIPRH